jgi:pimeloyl-ACP methyl ester carboxylesterase
MASLTHRTVLAGDTRIHLAEAGAGPLVLLVHGFPEGWYSWRHQLDALAAAGFRAAAVDVRGYGRSSRPAAVEAYRMLELVADNVAVVRALGEETATIVGHDWGSPIAATSALLHPEVFTAVGLLSVPYSPPGGPRPTDLYASIGGDDEFYVSYFQAPGRAEAEIEPDVRGWLSGLYAALTHEFAFMVKPGGRLADGFPAFAPSGWMSEADLDVYVGEFERTGLTGALNRYRNVDRDWEDLREWEGRPLTQRALFVAGERDSTLSWMGGAIAAFGETLPNLAGTHVLPDCGHWVQQEQPEAVNRLLLNWLAGD